MEDAAEKIKEVVGDTTQTQSAPLVKEDLEPEPTQTHLPSNNRGAQDVPYVPSGRLKNRRALITGGDSGVGRAVAIQFAMEGAIVVMVYLPSEEEDAMHTKAQVEKNGGEIMLIPCDLSHATNCKDAVTRATQALGGIDVLVNNAACRQQTGGIEDITEDQWAVTFRTNIDSYFHVTKYALPHIPEGGAIINSASVDSYIGVPSRIDYATTKGAVIAFTRALSNQLVKKGIRVNAVAAGPVWTPLVTTGVGEEGQGRGLGNWTPMNRLGQPSEVATSYVFLAGRESAFMSGQTLHPNGGIVVHG
ncbi:putative oxidoreductase C4H3.08 [Cladobotryum mycophilum]|uniref:Oxidoreductase C4H3.08 n=1 Tax=Cladobotryum mycophilum TaxID=491253 RepID=A0ABR0S8R5_9HYPO